MDYGSLPPELAISAEDIQKKERIAQLLLQRSMQGYEMPQQGRIASRVSPLAPMAQILTALVAKKAGDDASTGRADLAKRYDSFLQQGADDYMAKRRAPVAMDPQELSQPQDYGTPTPQAARGRDLAVSAMLSRNPAVQAIGKLDYENENKLDQPHTVAPGGSLVTGRGNVLSQQPPLHQIPQDWQTAIPPNAKRLPSDPPGVFRMPGASGVDDVYAVEFEGGKSKGYKRLDQDTGAGAANRAPYFTPVAGTGGLLYGFDHRTMSMTPLLDPKTKQPIVAGKLDPNVAGANAAAAEAGKDTAKVTADAQNTLQAAKDKTNYLLSQLDQLTGSDDGKVPPHRGFASAVGMTFKPYARHVHGTAEADFDNRLKHVQGQAFLEAYNALRGTGQVTEKEGQEAKVAISRMSLAQSENEFKNAKRDFETLVKQHLSRVQTLASRPLPQALPNAQLPPPPEGFEVVK